MGLFVPSKRPVPRRFDYEPRFYDPSQDESLRQRLRSARTVRKRSNPTRALLYGGALGALLYVLHLLHNVA